MNSRISVNKFFTNTKRALILFLIFSLPALAQEKNTPPVPGAGNVTLTLDEYDHLLELANKPFRKIDAAPLPYTIKRADLKFHVADDAVLGSIQLQGETFSRGETKVPLTTGMTILDARQEGRNLPLLQEGGTHTAVLPGASEFFVTLEAGLPLNIEAGRASMILPAPAAGSVRLTFVVPGDHTNVRLSPGLISNRTSEKGKTTIEATLVPGQNTSISWTTREIVAPAAPKEARFLSDLKTLITVTESDFRVTVLADISVVQGEPDQFQLEIPVGFEVTGTTGPSIDTTESQSGHLVIKVRSAAQRSHQFLISMERPLSGTNADAPFLTIAGTQRETGEILVEGAGTMELTGTEGGGLKRMDIREVNPYLRSLARFPLQVAFRYHRQPAETPTLALAWTRFPDGSVLAAIAERAEVTTLVTNEGRSLTEIKLTVKNQAQPFLKVELPPGASILSADVGGEKVKPVEGPDGNRVPLLRPGFRPTESYIVSFVFLHSGAPFAKKGGSELSLPKMDIPISLLHWELFLPEQYKVKDFGGDAVAENLLPASFVEQNEWNANSTGGAGFVNTAEGNFQAGFGGLARYARALLPGQLGGVVIDPSGAAVAGAQVTIVNTDNGSTYRALTDSSGNWTVSNVSPAISESPQTCRASSAPSPS